ncbi:MAG: membrane protein insertase YidC, partial [Amphritea sp.]|nr:membrane protein insertase YidC [Amphritea sp.]MBQ0783760.1 membrane protein insertase YidC [Amphritea sp.]
MDVQRIILIAALAIISYMLVLQWNQDYGVKTEPVAQAESVSAYKSVTEPVVVNEESDLPLSTNTVAPESSDLPEAKAVSATNQQQLIKVKTDVLQLLIDTKGGDIIEVALVDYKAALDNDQPFILLEQNGGRTYVSQSGLIGKDGPDANPE